MFERELGACHHCGYVELRQTHEEGVKRCPHCARPMAEIALSQARELVRRRREADQRREDAAKVAELGLDRQRWPEAVD
jgi:Zn finger protein HypA/HybF involved in hydrogenase expression